MKSKKPLFEEKDFGEVEQSLKKVVKKGGTPARIYKEELKQGSKEWFALRMGKFTGSKIPNLMKSGRAKDQNFGDVAKKAIMLVAIERDLTEDGTELYINELFSKEFRQTEWGNRYEEEARIAYMKEKKVNVDVTCFKVHKTLKNIGGSFDGEVTEEDGIVEIKCPYDVVKHQANVDLVSDGITPKHEYYGQIQCNIEVGGVSFCDFISFDPRRKTNSLAIIRVPRDQEYIDEMLKRIRISEKTIHYMDIGLSMTDSLLLAEEEINEEND